mgnify:CR=1 FL=1
MRVEVPKTISPSYISIVDTTVQNKVLSNNRWSELYTDQRRG